MKFKLTIAFDGTHYAGWQAQKTGVGVQQRIEEALSRIFPGADISRLHSSSRTDSGVHALGMVAQVEIPGLPDAGVQTGAGHQRHLPADARVMAAARCREDFDARFDATGKQYRYFVWNAPAMNPLLRAQAWHVARPLDLAAMRAAAKFFPGRHDFKSLAGTRNYEMKIHRAHLAAVRHPTARPAADLHHRGRRFSLQDVPGHCGNAGAGGAGEDRPGRHRGDSAPAKTAAPPE